MNLNKTIINLVWSGYIVRFKKLSSFTIEILVSIGRFFTVNSIDVTIGVSDEDFCTLLEYMKKEVDWKDLKYRKEKHDGSNW